MQVTNHKCEICHKQEEVIYESGIYRMPDGWIKFSFKGVDETCGKCHVLIEEAVAKIKKEQLSKCLHEHLTCPGDIRTVKCAYCNKSMYKKLQTSNKRP